jgi:predicted nucleotidyltransferase
MLKIDFVNAVRFLAIKLNDLQLNWLVGGSGALLIHGLDVVPNDIDLVVDPTDYARAKEALGDYLAGETDETG